MLLTLHSLQPLCLSPLIQVRKLIPTAECCQHTPSTAHSCDFSVGCILRTGYKQVLNLSNYPPSNSSQICFAALPQYMHYALHALPPRAEMPPLCPPSPAFPSNGWVPTPGQDPHPMLTGCAALKNTSPASNPKRLLCPRAERSKFASLCSPRGPAPLCQWHTAARCQARQEQDPRLPPTRQGCVGRGEHIPHRHQLSPSPAEATGRTAALLGVLHFAQQSLPSSGTGDG